MLRRILLSAVLMLMSASVVFAQKTVTGTVTDGESGFPLPGVNIAIKGTATGTATGIDGTYSMRVSEGDILVYSFVGYLPQEVTVGAQDVIDVALEEDVALLEEVVVVGYGTQRKADVTGAVGNVNVEQANVGLVQSPEQLIQGRVSGVQIIQNDGDPGAGVTIRVRGGTSISASNDPLYVIDGVPIDNSPSQPDAPGIGRETNNGPRNPLSFLNPSDIESIDILKDASAAAIYGSRGANGVVLITTKKGRAGQMQVNYSGRISGSSMRKKLDLLTAGEYRQFVSDNNLSADLGSSNTDWQDEVSQNAVSHEHNLSVAGGTEATRYRASVGYRDQDGLLINSGQERVTTNFSATHVAFDDKLDVNLNVNGSFVRDNLTPTTETNGFESTLLGNVMKFNPTLPVDFTNTDECPSGISQASGFCEVGTSVRNPVAIARQVDDFAKTTRVLGSFSAQYEFTPGLSGKVNLGLDRSSSVRRTYVPSNSPLAVTENGVAGQNQLDRGSRLIEVTGQYVGTFNDQHSINLLGGYSWQDFMVERFGVEVRDFVTDAWTFNNLSGGAAPQTPTSSKETNKLISFFGRANYDYDGRYLLTATLRRDGSSRFGEDEKWGIFPSASAAWRISQESFMREVDWIDDLKIRVGWGITGSQEIGNLRSLPTLEPNADFIAIIGGQEVVGVAPNNFATPNLKWEETKQLNIGLDFGLWSSRVTGSLEWYDKTTEDLLLEFEVPQPAAVPTRLANAGEVTNTGVELTLNAVALDRGDLTVDLSGTFAANKNEIVDLGGREQIFTGTVSGAGLSDINAQILTPGEPFGTFYGPTFLGFDPTTGEQLFELDGDGNRVNSIIGNAQPDFTYGFTATVNWKDLDVSLFLRGVQGSKLMNNTALEYTAKNLVNTNVNFLQAAVDDPTPLAEAPVYSSRWIQDASFLRAENLTIGYTFNNLTAFNNVVGTIRRARIYFTAQNLFVITSYDGWDPEVNTAASASIGDIPILALGIDYLNYPRPRTFTFGVDLSF